MERFLKAQETQYINALAEIKNGKKRLTGFGTYFHSLNNSAEAVQLNIMV